ncbi:hypothetical protein DRE_06637 [Drechslerella stenobrocha 248]|uniref:Uncharacterized protein n=1 Tax=Drechslerella stenobrocha 248 TaxID=1043628 RepID=W7HXK5_9PEZI|nr:hypothetical protein DRE_06637 [Drechslerella stenobrocha 248]
MATEMKRFSKPTLSAINTSFTSPAASQLPPVFSSATISSLASSVSPSCAALQHPSPRRFEALNSPLLNINLGLRGSSPPRSFCATSPTVPAEVGYSSPLSSTSDYYCLRQDTPFREQWSNTSHAPTPPPNQRCPATPQSDARRAAIRLWGSRISRGTPAPPSPPPQADFSQDSPKLGSPVEDDIEEFASQITQIHHHLARSDSLFKHGMMSVYMQQNAAAARLASSPTDQIGAEVYMFRPSSVDSVASTASFQRREQAACLHSAESRTRAMVTAQAREEQRQEFLKITLVDRIEREVAEIESRALRDMEMVREARYALRMEIGRQKARERRRALDAELARERERQAALDAQRLDEAEAARVLASLNAATLALADAYENEDDTEECIFHLSMDPHCGSESVTTEHTSSPSLSQSDSTRPSTSLSISPPQPFSFGFPAPATALLPPASNPGAVFKSQFVTYLMSPISPCSPHAPGAFEFGLTRQSCDISLSLALELTPSDAAPDVLQADALGTRGIVASCA